MPFFFRRYSQRGRQRCGQRPQHPQNGLTHLNGRDSVSCGVVRRHISTVKAMESSSSAMLQIFCAAHFSASVTAPAERASAHGVRSKGMRHPAPGTQVPPLPALQSVLSCPANRQASLQPRRQAPIRQKTAPSANIKFAFKPTFFCSIKMTSFPCGRKPDAFLLSAIIGQLYCQCH